MSIDETIVKLLKRYRKETPLGHQPHMISLEADEAIEAYEAAKSAEQPENNKVMESEPATGNGKPREDALGSSDSAKQPVMIKELNLTPEKIKELQKPGKVELYNEQVVDYRPHPDTSFEVRIKNALNRLNLNRNDIKDLPDGASLSRNVTDDRQIAELLEDLQNHLKREVSGDIIARIEALEKYAHRPVTFIEDENGYLKVDKTNEIEGQKP